MDDAARLERFSKIAVYVTDAICIPFKLFTLYIIVFHTPKRLRQVSLFILNEMFWNFLCNILVCFATLIPAMPAECFKFVDMYGWLAFLRPEFGGHLFAKVLFSLTSQYGVAIVLSFHFRYVAICHSQRMKTVHPAWGYFYCIGLHLVFAVFILYTLQQWEISLEDYPNPEEIAGKDGLFCYSPNEASKNLMIPGIFGMYVVFAILGVTPIVLSFLHLKRQEKTVQARTVDMQRKVLLNLVKLAAVPILMAAVPALVGAFCVYYTHLKGVNEVFLVCYLVILNHGTFYGIVTFCVFAEYRKVVKRMLLRIAHA
ncbi:hypothetical protein L596_020715 [Steinernema carpocapsae]|uniref:G-protein coupled receptors family 1 profile domain-containing protein n=1 Tax=Steinernema carpocapsae TaxID=34508 RepID=A0A4U5MV49_STECR|nr:hypothetical protein L596_020715 [Steinernema carpocapsae]